MPTTEELLEQLEAEAQSETPVCVIDPETRTITVPPEYQLLGVENDKRVERITFRCPKIVGDNRDLSQDYILFINYVNANGDPDAYKINDMQVEGDNITFSWLLEENVTKYQGNIQISFCGIIPGDEQDDPDKNRWGTTINTDCTVLTGLKCTQQVAESNPDALAQIWAAINELKAGGGSGTSGKDGREIEIQNNGTAIQWRYVGDSDWTDLVQLSDLKGEGVPEGGTTGQVLTKNSDSDGDAIWKDPISGMTTEQITALDNMFKICAFTTNPSLQYQAFCEAFGIEHEDIPEDSYTVSNNLTHVSNNNPALYVENSAPYSATLTADEGYILDSVIVEMDGFDITGTSYSDGKIIISAVTGNIIITAVAVQSSASGQLPQDGLLDYFDLRNKQYTAGGGGLYYINSDFGNGMLYSWSNQSSKQGDEIGIKGAAGNYTSVRATGYPVTDDFPSVRTMCLFGKGGPSVPNSIGRDGTLNNSFLYQIKYIATDKSTKILTNEQIRYPEGFSKNGYNASFVIVNQNILKVYFNDTLHKTVDGNEIEDFESWDITPLALTSFGNYGTAYAIYNKELSEVEIVEALEFFKTLEVSE